MSAFDPFTIKNEWQEEAVCRRCNKPFLTDCVEFHSGKVLRAGICDPCAAIREAREPQDVRDQKRKQIWDGWVGSYFYSFDPDRLPDIIRPHLGSTLKWNPDSTKGIGFLGKSHTGKSRVITELGRILYIRGVEIYPTSGIEFQEKVVGQVQKKDEFEAYMNRVKNCKVLLMDDADKVNFTPAVEAAYYGFLEHRRRFQRPMLVTVNTNGKRLAEAATENRGEAIVNRLRDLCEIIQLK